jgi:hypothetical protein
MFQSICTKINKLNFLSLIRISQRYGLGGRKNHPEKFIDDIQTRLCGLLVELQQLERCLCTQDTPTLLFLGVNNRSLNIAIVF